MSEEIEKNVKCVFNEKVVCPVREDMLKSKDLKKEVQKYIQPLGDKQVLQVFMPILDKLQEAQTGSEYKILHFYCALCRKLPE